jgi:hypothetical protein
LSNSNFKNPALNSFSPKWHSFFEVGKGKGLMVMLQMGLGTMLGAECIGLKAKAQGRKQKAEALSFPL